MSKKADNRQISEMRNLGPACEKDLNAVDIRTAEDVIRLGAEETFLRMLIGRSRDGRTTKSCNAGYLYAIYGAIQDLDWREIAKEKRDEFKAFTAEIRESGRFG